MTFGLQISPPMGLTKRKAQASARTHNNPPNSCSASSILHQWPSTFNLHQPPHPSFAHPPETKTSHTRSHGDMRVRPRQARRRGIMFARPAPQGKRGGRCVRSMYSRYGCPQNALRSDPSVSQVAAASRFPAVRPAPDAVCQRVIWWASRVVEVLFLVEATSFSASPRRHTYRRYGRDWLSWTC